LVELFTLVKVEAGVRGVEGEKEGTLRKKEELRTVKQSP